MMPNAVERLIGNVFWRLAVVVGLCLVWVGAAHAQSAAMQTGPLETGGAQAGTQSGVVATGGVRSTGDIPHSGSAPGGPPQTTSGIGRRSGSALSGSASVNPIVCYPTPEPTAVPTPECDLLFASEGLTSFTLKQRIRFDYGPEVQVAVVDHNKGVSRVQTASWCKPLAFDLFDGHWVTLLLYDTDNGEWVSENWHVFKFSQPGAIGGPGERVPSLF